MRKEDNDCIRYLMKEMDPSEELLMERAMMSDENLLIEVESMRQTYSKLDGLPHVEPPSHIQQSVLKQASEHAAKKRKTHTPFIPAFKYAVAATLALTITAGGAWFYLGGEGEEVKPSASAETPVQSVSTQNSALLFGQNIQTASAKAPKVEPWVDRNDILHFEDQFNNQQNISAYESILERSTQKLQLIEQPIFDFRPVKPIQLTGSAKN
ncbi:MAG TPA: hypothetical protein VFG39_00170 [Balneolaceae bacterium]|nr:hypothetical protein [Balneolaceae bacterium]